MNRPAALPAVSVITVSYNAERTLQETIDSVRKQDYPRVEHLVVDGGSTDATVQIIERNARHLASWSSEPDEGIYDAMNKGVAKATGDWTIFVNADDALYDANVLSRIFADRAAPGDGKLVVYGHSEMQLPNGRTRLRRSRALRTIRFKMPFTHQGVFVRTEVLRRRPFDTRYRVAADYDFFRDIYGRHGEAAFQDVGLRVNYFRVGGVSYQQLARKHREFLAIIERHERGWRRAFYTTQYVVRCLVPERLRDWAGRDQA